MARFKYMGEKGYSWVTNPGHTTKIILPTKAGGKVTLTPVPPATEFVKEEDIGHTITDEVTLMVMRCDTRFVEL